MSAIFTPDTWLWNGGQFSFAVDYININVKGQITQLGPTQHPLGCYTSDNFPTDPLCSLFTRAPAAAANKFNIETVHDPYLNINQQLSKSVDFTLRYRQDLGRWGSLSLLGQMTYQFKDKFTLFQQATTTNNGRAGDPKWVADFNLSWNKAPFTFTYGLNVIAGTNDFRNLQDVGGSNLTLNNCLATDSAFALRNGPYCPIYKLPRVAYHSLSAEVQVTRDFSFLFGVSNLFDKKPPRFRRSGRRSAPSRRCRCLEATTTISVAGSSSARRRSSRTSKKSLATATALGANKRVGGQQCSPTLCFMVA